VEVESPTVIDPNVWEGWGDSSLLQEELAKRRERLAPLGRMARYEYLCGACRKYVWFDADDTGKEFMAGSKVDHPCYDFQSVPEQEPEPEQEPRSPYWWKDNKWNTHATERGSNTK
jgi:hypothetical protein